MTSRERTWKMLDECFRHQMADMFGGKEIPAPHVPWNHSRENVFYETVHTAVSDQGRDDVLPLDLCELCGHRLDGASLHFCHRSFPHHSLGDAL